MKAKFLRVFAIVAVISMLFSMPAFALDFTPPAKLDSSTTSNYIVRFEGEPLATYKGGVAGLAATSPQATGQNKLNVNSPASVAYRAYLSARQNKMVASIEMELARSVNVVYKYDVVLNAVAMKISAAEAKQIAALPGVVSVEAEGLYELETDVSGSWIGADMVWSGEASGTAAKGDGIVVGVIDTGINPSNPSFADVGGDGYEFPEAEQFYGACDPESEFYTTTVSCNNKLIGMYDFTQLSAHELNPVTPLDVDGHGSHTASTAAGNVVTEAVIMAPTTSVTRSISGMAPHAQLITYRACYPDLRPEINFHGCPGSALIAGIEQAVTDGVDVINYSIGGGPGNPWSATDGMAFLAAREAGVFVATSAGNDGPDAATVGSPANAPWVTSAAATTHDRKFYNTLGSLSPDGPADIVGLGITAGYGPAEIVYSGWYSSVFTESMDVEGDMYDPDELAAMCLVPFPADTFDGEIVVCDRGVIARVGKGANVLEGGAGGYVLANDSANGNSLVADPHYLPGVHITYNDGVTLMAWLTNTVVQTATISGVMPGTDVAAGDIMASFSSRGPNFVPGVIKPDLGAPGVDIMAALGTDDEIAWGTMSGTSMASPHVAGAGALLKQLHPDWTPAEIQSALMSTAVTEIRKEDGATAADPFDVGAGRIDLSMAAKAGLVLDETTEDYTAANPATGGDPKTLNIASMANELCMSSCSWTRTLKSSVDFTETWSISMTEPMSVSFMVEPMSFELAPGMEQVITITADTSALPYGEWAFGEISAMPTTTDTAKAHFPVAVKSEFSVIPSMVNIDTIKEMSSITVPDIKVNEVISGFTTTEYGLTQATLHQAMIVQDPTNDSVLDDFFSPDFGTLFVVTTTVETDQSVRLVAEVLKTTSYDLDMFIIYENEAGGLYWACQSATGSALEYCSVDEGLAPGTYYVIVQNWLASDPTTANLPDRTIVATALVPMEPYTGTMANMEVTGPANVALAEPFDATLAWDLDPMEDDAEQTLLMDELGYVKFYGAFDMGTTPATVGNMGYVPVDLTLRQPQIIFLPLVLRLP